MQVSKQEIDTPLDWLIIGGGIHGMHIAARLLGDVELPRESLRIVDPGQRLLARWRRCTETTGMTHLRSPSVHHLGIDHGELRRFAHKGRTKPFKPFAPPFDRPSLGLFNAHCDQIENAFELTSLHVRDRALRCSIDCDRVAVQLASGRTFHTKNLVLAIGGGEHLRKPDWARGDMLRIRHVFERDFDGWPTSPETVLVVGGGISAAHVVLRLVSEGHRVHHVSRHPLRMHQFDSDPGWLGVKYASQFCRTNDLERRRSMINTARNTGSVPPHMMRALRRASAKEQLQWHQGEVTGLAEDSSGYRISLTEGDNLDVDRVLLATGFDAQRPGGRMIDELIESASLPCAKCGYPIVDAALRWHPRVYVTGPLAELELGPVSRNIAGARWAGDRIVDAIRAHRVS